MTVAVAIYSFFLASGGSWNPDAASKFDQGSEFFYWSQAKNLLRGHLYVTPPSPRLWWLECFTIEHECYGYFGLGPAILRVPPVVLFGDTFAGLVPLFVALGIGLAFWAAMDIVRMMFGKYAERTGLSDRVLTRWFVVVGLVLGPGSVLVLLARGRVYEEAIVWAVAFLCLTFNLVYRWSQTRSTPLLLGAIFTGSMATLSRPSAIPAVVVLGAVVVAIVWRDGSWKLRCVGLALAVVPAALFIVVFQRKFGSLNFPWRNYGPYISTREFREVIRANHGSTVGLRFLPTTLANYFRPDSLRFELGAPWVSLASVTPADLLVLPPATARQIWGDRIPSLTNVMPVPVVMTCVALATQARAVIARRTRGASLIPAAMLVAGVAGVVPAFAYYAVAGRYLGDLYPLLVVGTAVGVPTILKRARTNPRLEQAVFATIAFFGLASSFVLYQIHESVF